ncbi:hypothetical protein F2Q69_00049018 [Brassica cretica]|uniref:Uncharacterized protein n=1 Tax=Brassica cretica TaxID=69181 RepID=A0A8S9PFX7_BRACR|nr:hypothetical protein F2Q69_00049018 [Brassica cretica]
MICANDCSSRWFLVGSEDNNSFQLVLETPWLRVTEKEDDLLLGFGRAMKRLLRSEDVFLIALHGKIVFSGSRV